MLLLLAFIVYCAAIFATFHLMARRRYRARVQTLEPRELSTYARRGDPRDGATVTCGDATVEMAGASRDYVVAVNESNVFFVPTSSSRFLGEPSLVVPRTSLRDASSSSFVLGATLVSLSSYRGVPLSAVIEQGPSAVSVSPLSWRSEPMESDTIAVGSLMRSVHVAGALVAIFLVVVATMSGHDALAVGFGLGVVWFLGVTGRRFRHADVTVQSARQLSDMAGSELVVRAAVSSVPLLIAGILGALLGRHSALFSFSSGVALTIGFSTAVSFTGFWRLRNLTKTRG